MSTDAYRVQKRMLDPLDLGREPSTVNAGTQSQLLCHRRKLPLTAEPSLKC